MKHKRGIIQRKKMKKDKTIIPKYPEFSEFVEFEIEGKKVTLRQLRKDLKNASGVSDYLKNTYEKRTQRREDEKSNI